MSEARKLQKEKEEGGLTFSAETIRTAADLLRKDVSLENLFRTMIASRQLYSICLGTLQSRLAGERSAAELESYIVNQVKETTEKASSSDQNVYFDLLYVAAPWLATEIKLTALRRSEVLRQEMQRQQQ